MSASFPPYVHLGRRCGVHSVASWMATLARAYLPSLPCSACAAARAASKPSWKTCLTTCVSGSSRQEPTSSGSQWAYPAHPLGARLASSFGLWVARHHLPQAAGMERHILFRLFCTTLPLCLSCSVLDLRTVSGLTPLHFCAHARIPGTAAILLSAGANANLGAGWRGERRGLWHSMAVELQLAAAEGGSRHELTVTHTPTPPLQPPLLRRALT